VVDYQIPLAKTGRVSVLRGHWIDGWVWIGMYRPVAACGFPLSPSSGDGVETRAHPSSITCVDCVAKFIVERLHE